MQTLIGTNAAATAAAAAAGVAAAYRQLHFGSMQLEFSYG